MTTPPQHPLQITAKYHWLSFLLASVRPKATINGYDVPLNWGENVIPAPPGRHEITIHVPYLWTFGKATMTVDNTVGAPVVHYAAPVWTWQRGAIGPVPQRHPGLTGAWVFYGIFFAALLICCASAVLSGGGS